MTAIDPVRLLDSGLQSCDGESLHFVSVVSSLMTSSGHMQTCLSNQQEHTAVIASCFCDVKVGGVRATVLTPPTEHLAVS